MSLLVVTAFHSGDAKAALRLWNWIETLGKIDNDVLLVCEPLDDRLEQNRVLLAAKRAAKSVTRIFTDGKHENKWPQGPNAAFLAAAKYASEKRRNFLWLEADCVPIKQGWIREIETEYAQCGKQYLGGIVDCHPPLPKQVMYGVAVYRHTVLSIASQAIDDRPDIAFDVSMSPSTVPLAAKSRLLQISKPDSNAFIVKETVLYHSDKSGRVIDSLLNKKCSTGKPPCISRSDSDVVGYHFGDRGDVIYSLPLCRMLGVTRLVLCPHSMTRETMTHESAESIATLIREQPYIDSVEFLQEPPRGAIDLNKFRELLGQRNDGRFFYHNLTALQLRAFGYPEWHECDRWLWVTKIKPPKPVVFARSSRYHSKTFDWKAVFEKYGKDAVFIGTVEEHKDFCKDVGDVQYHKTNNLLEVAQVIEGSELFVGNQSCPFAIAEGLKHNAILEWTTGPSQNCHFSRPNLYYGTEHINAPVPHRKPTVNWVALSDLHSGFGRMAHAFYIRSKSIDFNWVPTRFSEEFCSFDKSIDLANKRMRCQSVVLDSIPVIHEFIKPGDIALSMWESTRLPKTATSAINTCKASIVPSQWCCDIYKESGVKVPIYKVPLGVDNVLYRPPQTRQKRDVLVFGASCRFCNDGNPRKNVSETIEGFKIAFHGIDDVRLVIKGYDTEIAKIDDPRISIISEFWSDSRLARWYQSLDCLINISRGGGWELHVHEAMLCGVVPIVLNYSSSLEFVTGGCGYLVDYKEVTADWHVYKGCGQWAVPNMDHYVSTLRHVYNNRDEIELKRPKARRAVEHLTWDNASGILDRVLLDIL